MALLAGRPLRGPHGSHLLQGQGWGGLGFVIKRDTSTASPLKAVSPPGPGPPSWCQICPLHTQLATPQPRPTGKGGRRPAPCRCRCWVLMHPGSASLPALHGPCNVSDPRHLGFSIVPGAFYQVRTPAVRKHVNSGNPRPPGWDTLLCWKRGPVLSRGKGRGFGSGAPRPGGAGRSLLGISCLCQENCTTPFCSLRPLGGWGSHSPEQAEGTGRALGEGNTWSQGRA